MTLDDALYDVDVAYHDDEDAMLPYTLDTLTLMMNCMMMMR